jgi:uncharacterized protein (UPF0261 family)
MLGSQSLGNRQLPRLAQPLLTYRCVLLRGPGKEFEIISPVFVVATLDTKAEEAFFVAEALREDGVPAAIVDVGVFKPPIGDAQISRKDVAAFHPDGAYAVLSQQDRGAAIAAMSDALRLFLADACEEGLCSGVIGLGGSGGTALIARAMRGLPIGFPKLMVSTVASGDTSSYIGTSDITMMFSVVDVAGLNRVSRRIYRNAASAMAGMARSPQLGTDDRPAVGMTMFGLTTPCVNAVRQRLTEQGYDCLVFHATGVGGRAMEELARSGFFSAVIDITTTEVADEIAGGVFPAGSERFNAILEKRLPYVMSLGALDMVNFGPLSSVPLQFKNRKLHIHNPSITLMRTNVEENRAAARWIAGKLNLYPASAFTLLIPEGGLSDLDKPGQPFFDPQADQALFDELERLVTLGPGRRIVRYPLHINDPRFAEAIHAEIGKLKLS